MPKPRQTCTRCSMRRQKCDRRQPCTRCVRDSQGDSCSLEWPSGYDPRIHRKYPSSRRAATKTASLNSDNVPVVHQIGRQERPSEQSLSQSSTVLSSPSASRPTSNLATTQTAPADFGVLLASINPYQPRDLSNMVGNTSSINPPAEPSGIRLDASHVPQNEQTLQNLRSHGHPEQDIAFLQSLIPSRSQLLQLVDYHEANILWYHSAIHGPTFRNDLANALQNSDNIEIKNLDMRWCALLFAVMSSSLACANAPLALTWGFERTEKRLRGKQWYEAVSSCLQLGAYALRHSIYSIQAIHVGGFSAHILGFSNEQFVLYGAAFRIAQSLGLQRLAIDLAPDGPDKLLVDASPPHRDLLIKREVGRKTWIGLCTQDWLSIGSSEMYFLNKQHFTTSKPRRIDDETMEAAGDQVPIGIDFGNYMFDVASLMAEYHDATTASEDSDAQYDAVLKYDTRLRALGTSCLPPSILVDVPGSPKPPWVAWARHTALVLHAHKIIMIHRKFLCRSFTDPRYAYTRWASVNASKKILNEMLSAPFHIEMPALWSCQVHLVAAGITLCLDFLNHSETDPEFAESRRLVDKTIYLLRSHEDSTLASRGVQLLSSLLTGGKSKNLSSLQPHGPGPISRPLENTPGMDVRWVRTEGSLDDDPSAVGTTNSATGPGHRLPCGRWQVFGAENAGGSEVPPPTGDHFQFTHTGYNEFDGNVAPDMSFFDLFSEYYPTLSGFDNASLIEDLFR